MSAHIRLHEVHPVLKLELLCVFAIWAGLLWCVAESEERAMQQRVEVRP